MFDGYMDDSTTPRSADAEPLRPDSFVPASFFFPVGVADDWPDSPTASNNALHRYAAPLRVDRLVLFHSVLSIVRPRLPGVAGELDSLGGFINRLYQGFAFRFLRATAEI